MHVVLEPRSFCLTQCGVLRKERESRGSLQRHAGHTQSWLAVAVEKASIWELRIWHFVSQSSTHGKDCQESATQAGRSIRTTPLQWKRKLRVKPETVEAETGGSRAARTVSKFTRLLKSPKAQQATGSTLHWWMTPLASWMGIVVAQGRVAKFGGA